MTNTFRALPAFLPGVHLLEPRQFTDARGSFVKTYHDATWAGASLYFTPREEYYSISHRGVLRGMHFQIPPHDHVKVVYCPSGRVMDVLLDLRRNSPTFGQCMAQELSAENRLILFIPAGLAHGFLSLEDRTVMVYKATIVHSPAHDAGVRWNSFGFKWEHAAPVVSDRDAAFPALADFASPFD